MILSDARVALLTNFLPPYRLPVLRSLAGETGHLRVFLSTAMESGRDWPAEWEGLDVVVQKGLTVPRVRRHPGGFEQRYEVHYPADTLPRLARFRPDVVVSGEFGTRSLQAALWCVLTGTPLVIWATLSERTEQGRGRLRRALRRLILARANAVIVNGESGARYIRSFGYPEHRIRRVPQASPAGRTAGPRRVESQPEVSGEHPLRVLYAGQLVDGKGLRRALAGLAGWCASRGVPVALRLVGSGPEAAALRQIGGSDLLSVEMPGAVPFEALDAEYAAADVFLFPSLGDEWGLVVNEAMSAGVPVVGSVHSQAVLELVEDGVTGWRYDPDAEGGLEDALDRMHAKGRAGIHRIGRAARERVAELTPENMAAQLAEAVASVLGSKGGRP